MRSSAGRDAGIKCAWQVKNAKGAALDFLDHILEKQRMASSNRAVVLWLWACLLCVLGMVLIGGLTRLTGSGLSIVEWKPVSGILPPLNVEAWQREFAAYQQSPQYLKLNHGMELGEFKQIFWFEYLHRLWGRLTGLIFFVPYLFFVFRGAIGKPLALKLFGIFLLGGLQGAIGWYMVKSGLVDHPYVSHLRLALHLGFAMLIHGAILWTILNLTHGGRPTGKRAMGMALLASVTLQMLLGAMVAGLHGALVYNDFPLMNGAIFPPEGFALSPWWMNFFEDIATVQFMHRLLGIAIFFLALQILLNHQREKLPMLLFMAILAQILLGVATLRFSAPLWLAELHQLGAFAVFSLTILFYHAARFRVHNMSIKQGAYA